MRILERRELWIHTHFLTDCVRLSEDRGQQIQEQIQPFLKKLGIVYGLHFEERPGEKGLRIVLECIPFRETLERIHLELQRIVKDIPAKPRPTRMIRFEKAPPVEHLEEARSEAVGRSEVRTGESNKSLKRLRSPRTLAPGVPYPEPGFSPVCRQSHCQRHSRKASADADDTIREGAPGRAPGRSAKGGGRPD